MFIADQFDEWSNALGKRYISALGDAGTLHVAERFDSK
jgi:hypothetical protein